MNTIVIDDFNKVGAFVFDDPKQSFQWEMPFPEFRLTINDYSFYVKDVSDDEITYRIYIKNPDYKGESFLGEFLWNFTTKKVETINVSEQGRWIFKQPFEFYDFHGQGIYLFDNILPMTLGYITERSKERGRRTVRDVSHKPKYSREHRLSTSNNKIYLLDDIITYASEKYVPESGHSEYTCPCWEVRGHYRHYKNGNVIFIKSYKKGKEKDKTEPISHEYRLERGQK